MREDKEALVAAASPANHHTATAISDQSRHRRIRALSP
ncbi:hypothetical protein L195_g024650, partial [Trifolium pratense]